MPTRLGPDRSARRIRATLERTGRRGCLLCGAPSAAVGLWVASAAAQRRLMAPTGKARMVAYALCRQHAERPGIFEDVERAIVADIAAAAGEPGMN